jgi:hypothetical protein
MTLGGRWWPTHGEEEPAAGDPVPDNWLGGLARARTGGHSGGVNLTSGGLGRPIHGEVAGFRGGEVAGEAAGRDGGQGLVRCVRGGMVKFVNHFNLISKILERGGGAHGSRGRRRRRA